MGTVQQSLCRSLRLKRKCTLLYVLLATGLERTPWARHASPQMAADAPVRIPSSATNTNQTGTCAPTGTVDDSDRPSLAQEGIVHRGHGTARQRAVVSPRVQRSALSFKDRYGTLGQKSGTFGPGP